MPFSSLLDRLARLSPRYQALEAECARLTPPQAQAPTDQAEALREAVEALLARNEALEAELYLARSDQQRSALLADSLRARLADAKTS